MSNWFLAFAFVCGMCFVFLIAIVLITGDFVTLPDCQEDEYIYYEDYPDEDTLICVHIDEIRR